MYIKEYRSDFIQSLTATYDAGEAESFFYLILEQLKQMRRVDLALNPEAKFTEEEVVQWNQILELLKAEKPIQYILGTTSFYGLEFEVNENVLIPRPETEELVEWIVRENATKGPVRILDIGTGSGCIAITLAKELPDAKVSAIDVSSKAIETAQRNAQRNGVAVNFVLQDILAANILPDQYDVIVSNPPYIRELEKVEIKNNVLENEPHLALFVSDADPLIFYRKISELAIENLQSKGTLYFEINQYLGVEMKSLMQEKGFQNVELIQDIYGNERMMKGSL
ncbi:peptide chain release factor N(5)-glutamine methyltransferase [Flavobacterium sp. '19STA2R22 D10 B1']|uniref:peptide chain release factor N(5)-glutamine methyltransferase n=1 Tax=Flavobacterium aerium TaxID=3037261 RepID=UPI00278C5F5C|nr:peptide chain release factor N(5)-glutamine methyltransferase [Flavobacterium sp. '19STA2R22 D10 B1']